GLVGTSNEIVGALHPAEATAAKAIAHANAHRSTRSTHRAYRRCADRVIPVASRIRRPYEARWPDAGAPLAKWARHASHHTRTVSCPWVRLLESARFQAVLWGTRCRPLLRARKLRRRPSRPSRRRPARFAGLEHRSPAAPDQRRHALHPPKRQARDRLGPRRR